jgi:hypothetical protein
LVAADQVRVPAARASRGAKHPPTPLDDIRRYDSGTRLSTKCRSRE